MFVLLVCDDLPTKSSMCWRILVKRIDAYYLVVCARGKILAVGGKADCVDCARVMAHSRKLLRLCIVGIVRVEYSFRRPYSYITI